MKLRLEDSHNLCVAEYRGEALRLTCALRSEDTYTWRARRCELTALINLIRRKRMTERTGVQVGRRIVVLASTALAVAGFVPAVAGARGTRFVPPAAVKGPFNSCATPGSKSIQEAVTVTPSKTTIHVCAGSYTE